MVNEAGYRVAVRAGSGAWLSMASQAILRYYWVNSQSPTVKL
jgi:hypothetical protein